MNNQESTRRVFVGAMAGVAAVVALPVLNGTICAAEDTAPAAGDESAWMATVKPNDLKDGGFVSTYAAKRFVLARTGNKVVALDTRCTHKGCAVKPMNGVMGCPCHGAKYDGQGNVLHGPARIPLARHPIRLNKDGVIEVDPTQKLEQDDAAGVLELAATTQAG